MSNQGKTHTQCLLKKANLEQVSWIPSKYATKGKYVKLRHRGQLRVMDSNGNPDDFEYDGWDDGWLVAETWASRDSSEANEDSQDCYHQHEASDAYHDKDGHWITPKKKKEKKR